MKKVKIYFLLICLMVGFTACSTPQPSPKNHTHPKILRYALAQEPNTLDPQKVDASPEATIAYHIYEGL
ncbi:MAG: peptide ABC transporter substrate-binding protein, partial [Christensenellales bacterium]